MSSLEIARIANSLVLIILGTWISYREKSKVGFVSAVVVVLMASASLNAVNVGIDAYSSWKRAHETATNREQLEIGFARRLETEVRAYVESTKRVMQGITVLSLGVLKANSVDEYPDLDALIKGDKYYLILLGQEHTALSNLSGAIHDLRSNYEAGLDKATYRDLVATSDWVDRLQRTVSASLKYFSEERDKLLNGLNAERELPVRSAAVKNYLTTTEDAREKLWKVELTYSAGLINFYNKILDSLLDKTRAAEKLAPLDTDVVMRAVEEVSPGGSKWDKAPK